MQRSGLILEVGDLVRRTNLASWYMITTGDEDIGVILGKELGTHGAPVYRVWFPSCGRTYECVLPYEIVPT